MSKSIGILDNEYREWVKDLALRYRNRQIKAAVKVNTEMLGFYWELGRDIVELHVEKRWGDKVMSRLSVDLREAMPGVSGLTQRNIYYAAQHLLLQAILSVIFFKARHFAPAWGKLFGWSFAPACGTNPDGHILCAVGTP